MIILKSFHMIFKRKIMLLKLTMDPFIGNSKLKSKTNSNSLKQVILPKRQINHLKLDNLLLNINIK